jgi:hypothetical protein
MIVGYFNENEELDKSKLYHKKGEILYRIIKFKLFIKRGDPFEDHNFFSC